ncbi:MAG TPA: hypothetical protein VLY03_01120 [Bacteroidota bacterium]|nr:hypothetical protein [Bacteroidota bacterium]
MHYLAEHQRLSRLFFRWAALVLAVSYFGFRTELFESEYDDAHPKIDGTCAITGSSLNWETFDKDNAPQAFTFTVPAPTETVFTLPPVKSVDPTGYIPYRLIQDKSPPISAS